MILTTRKQGLFRIFFVARDLADLESGRSCRPHPHLGALPKRPLKHPDLTPTYLRQEVLQGPPEPSHPHEGITIGQPSPPR